MSEKSQITFDLNSQHAPEGEKKALLHCIDRNQSLLPITEFSVYGYMVSIDNNLSMYLDSWCPSLGLQEDHLGKLCCFFLKRFFFF